MLYVAALALAPLSLVQAASAGGIAVLAIGGPRLTQAERVGVAASLGGLVLLGLSLGSHQHSTHGNALSRRRLDARVGRGCGRHGSAAAAGRGARHRRRRALRRRRRRRPRRRSPEARGCFFVPALLACHGAAFACLQLAFQRGGRLATAGLAVLWTNALPIVAGTVLFGESLPGGWRGAARIAAFALVLVGARRAQPARGAAGRRRPCRPFDGSGVR